MSFVPLNLSKTQWPTLFEQIYGGSHFRHHPMYEHGDKARQEPKITQGGSVFMYSNMGVRRAGIQRCTTEATQQPTDFLSPGQREFTTLQMLAVFCLPGVVFFLSYVWLQRCSLNNINGIPVYSAVPSWFDNGFCSVSWELVEAGGADTRTPGSRFE